MEEYLKIEEKLLADFSHLKAKKNRGFRKLMQHYKLLT